MSYLILMFDAFMQATLPFWLLLSALFPVVLAGMLIKALFQLRRMRGILDELARPQVNRWSDPQDWLPAP